MVKRQIEVLRAIKIITLAGLALATLLIFRAKPVGINELKVPEDWLLPDLVDRPPRELLIQKDREGKKLRFETSFVNVGVGELRLLGENDTQKEVTRTKQIIQKRDGGVEEVEVGEFVFHIQHDHWHVDRYHQFELWQIDAERLPLKLLVTTDKLSFCIWDETAFEPNVPNAAKIPVFPRCRNNIQGASIGWGDSYSADTEGQELNISDVPDGQYLVKSIINIDRNIKESNYDNNEARLYIRIEGNRVEVVE